LPYTASENIAVRATVAAARRMTISMRLFGPMPKGKSQKHLSLGRASAIEFGQ
tara:strand:- start:268 stop:426 length:159 start_codon:yes stop_codon:yes gene_type:complete